MAMDFAPPPRFPAEIFNMFIQHLPLESLIQAARVCIEFQLESEAHIYRHININPSWDHSVRFKTLSVALVAQPRRQALVRSIDISTNDEKLWFDVCLKFLLSNLPDVESLKMPTWYQVPHERNILLKTECRFKELSIGRVYEWPGVLDLLRSQPSIRELYIGVANPSLLSLNLHISHLLPNLEFMSGESDTISCFVPGRAVSKVHVKKGFSASRAPKLDDYLPALLQSTAKITELQLDLTFLSPSDLTEIAGYFPALEFLGLQEPDWNIDGFRLSHFLAWLPKDDIQLLVVEGRECLEFTPTVVNLLFSPLHLLPLLRTFTFQYTSFYLHTSPPPKFADYDLTKTLEWKDTATPHLESLRFNHTGLQKDASGAWVQVGHTMSFRGRGRRRQPVQSN